MPLSPESVAELIDQCKLSIRSAAAEIGMSHSTLLRYINKEAKRPNKANMQKLLLELKEATTRKAQFRTSVALILNGEEYFFDGIIRGTILTEKRGEKGFGYDPLFVPEGYVKTFA